MLYVLLFKLLDTVVSGYTASAYSVRTAIATKILVPKQTYMSKLVYGYSVFL